MSKIDLDPITSGYNLSKINANFQKVEDELNNKVLYRNPPAGEPNSMSSNLDMNSRSILNANKISSNVLELGGVQVVPTSLAIDPYNGTREALRRSYAEAGYNLVDGSFEAGGTLVNANDVLLQERTGKGFTGPAGEVAAGTNPASGGFVDRSGITAGFAGVYRRYTTVAQIMSGEFPVGTRLTLVDRGGADFDVVAGGVANGFNILDAGAGNTAQLVVRSGVINTQHWGMVADFVSDSSPGTDNKLAFAALTGYINNQHPTDSFTILVHGDMGTSDTIILHGGGTYGGRAIRLESAGSKAIVTKTGSTTSAPLHGVVYLKKPSTAGAFACANIAVTKLVLRSQSADYGVCSNDPVTMFSDDDDLDITLTKPSSIGYYFTNNIYINHFGGGILACAGLAFKNTLSGTTNYFNNLFASNCQNGGFSLRMAYSTIGSLAADGCVGVIYDFAFSQLSVGSLGCESPLATTVVRATNGAAVEIGNIFLYNQSPSQTFTVANADSKSIITVGNVNSYIPSETPTVMSGARLISCYGTGTNVRVEKVSGHYIYGLDNRVDLGSSITVGDRSGELINLREAGIATCGGGKSSNPQWYMNNVSRPAKTFFMNHGGNQFTLADGTDVKFNGQGLKVGDIIWLNNAGNSGATAMVVTTPGSDFINSSYKYLPVEEYVNDVASLPTANLRTGRRVTVISIHKTLTYYSSGVSGWYDESGTKVA